MLPCSFLLILSVLYSYISYTLLIIDFSPLVFLSIWLHGMVIIYLPFASALTKFSHSNIGPDSVIPDSVDHASRDVKILSLSLFCIVFPRFLHFLIARLCSSEFQFEKICDLKINKCDSKNLTNKNFGLWCLFGFSFEYSLCSLFVCLVMWLLFCQMGQLDRPRTLYFWRYNTHSSSTINLSTP